MKLFIKVQHIIKMLSEDNILKLICIGWHNCEQTPYNICDNIYEC